jgi:uncharacterized NAD(P)/FAD-binding protein YdhS
MVGGAPKRWISRMMRNVTVAIAGGGASGTLLAAALVRSSSDARVVIVEPRDRLGAGVAYSTDCIAHLLNVPAAGMTAFPDDPQHFVRWLRENGYVNFNARSFVPRPVYAEYLGTIAAEMLLDGRLIHVRATATDVEVLEAGVRITCSNGEFIEAEKLVLASGNAAPAAWPRISEGAKHSKRFFGSAWDEGAMIPHHTGEEVLLLGTGLTAVDAVLGLRQNGHRGTISMVSRRGLLPHEHRLFDTPPAACPDAQTSRDLIDSVRTSAQEYKDTKNNWRPAIDGVRPSTNALWQALTIADQRQFVRHVMPYWNVHRHRMAPEVAKTLAELMARDRLRMLAGRTGEITETEDGLHVPIRLRGSDETLPVFAGRVINCSGPEHDFRKLANPLIQRLLAQGHMAPYALNIGIQVAKDGALIDADGNPSQRLFTIGPVRFGALIETTAIPEVRIQARDLAEFLTAAENTRTALSS